MPSPGDVPIYIGPNWGTGAPPSGSGGVVVSTYTATTAGAVAALQGLGLLPSTGTIACQFEGFGGGGGGGGAGGAVNCGAGGGGSRYQSAIVLLDLTHSFDVTIGAGGAGGTAGTTTVSGLNGSDGSPTLITDTTSAIVLAALSGASGGHGSVTASGGSTIPGGDHESLLQGDSAPIDANVIIYTSASPHSASVSGAGGPGQSSSKGYRAQTNTMNIGTTPAVPVTIGAPGGVFVTGASGAGGGTGPRGAGGIGGLGVDPGTGSTPGNPGIAAAANTGGGGGGGSPAGNGAPQQAGGAGGNGGTGWARATFYLNTQVAP